MRLTLRTMLAYLDDVLDSTDAQELEHKIKESSLASGLVHRVRESMRQVRLGAPKLDGKGLGLDPNTVADYLDSTLAPERVPEFEKVCLESDVHLAEVASCHQILTLVLGEPAQVDAAMRERAYRIGHPENRQPKQVSAVSGSEVPSAAARGELVRPKNVQRPSQLSAKSLAITVLLGFLLALVALQAVGVSRLRNWIGLSSPREVVERPESAPREATGGQVPEAETTSPAEVESIPRESSAPTATSEVGAAPSAVSPAAATRPALSPKPPVDLRPEMPAEKASPESAAKVEEATGGLVDRPPVESVEPTPRPDVAPPLGEGASETDAGSFEKSERPAEISPTEPPRQVPVGRYISEEQVLAQFDDTANDWFRLEPDSPLVTGRRLIVLPTYRPQLLLAPNIKMTVVGETHLMFDQADEGAAPLVKIDSGRAIIVPLGDPEGAVLLEAAGHTGSVSFADAESILAVDVMKYLPPGQQPALEPAMPIIQIFALSGNVTWSEDNANEFVVGAGQVLTKTGDGSPVLYEASELPSWLDGKDLADIDRLASNELRRNLATDRPLSLSLLERTEFRQVEVRSLACRSLCALDMFDPAIEALDGASLRSYWYAQFDAIRGAMARSPESAIRLQRSLEKLTGDDAGLMYELFCGFSPDQLLAGGAKELVDALEHERISTRVLAYENLRRITDKTQLFRPEQPPTQQKGEVMKWRRNLEAGAIVYQQPPAALPPRSPVAADEAIETPAEE